MEFDLLGKYVHELALYNVEPPVTRVGLQAYGIAASTIAIGKHCFIEHKLFLSVPDGVVIIPEDYSYKRFIANSWYVDINTDNL